MNTSVCFAPKTMEKEKKDVFKENCNCKLLSVSHFKVQCAKIARRKAYEDWQKRQQENEEKARARQERRAVKDAEEDPIDDASTAVSEPFTTARRGPLLFTAQESQQLKRIKVELQEY